MTKKAFLLLAAVMFFSAAISAQTYFNVGYGRQQSITTIDGEDSSSKPSDAIIAGVSHNFNLFKGLGVEVGVGYMFDYASKELTTLADSRTVSKYQGMLVPVELNYGFELGSIATLRVFAGPTFHYGFSDKLTTIMKGKEMGTTDYYERETRKPFMMQLAAGVEADVANMFRVKVGYSFGLTDFDTLDYAELHKHALSISLGYIF